LLVFALMVMITILTCWMMGGIYNPGITAAMPQIVLPHTPNDQEKMDYCSKLSGDGDAVAWSWGHECVYNCTTYWPSPCLDHGWHYEKGATSVWGNRSV
jgi:hypothetical protein